MAVLGLLVLPCNGFVWAKGSSDHQHSHVEEPKASVHVEFVAKPQDTDPSGTVGLQSSQPLKIRFNITDKKTQFGLSELHPLAWITPRLPGAGKPSQQQCESNIKLFLKAGVSVKSESDLNNYYILTLNSDNTVSILNPSVNLATSHLLALIPLGGEADSWVFDEDRGKLYVSLKDKDRITVLDIHQRVVESNIPVGKSPGRILLPKNNKYIWIANDGSGSISVIDRKNLEVVDTLELGKGPFELAYDYAGRQVFVSDLGKGQLVVVDSNSRKIKNKISIPDGTHQIAYSKMSKRIYVAYPETGELRALYPDQDKSERILQMDPGIKHMQSSPDGRFLFILNELKDRMVILDTSTNKVKHRIRTGKKPYHLQFSDQFAYVRFKESSKISLLQLSALKQDDTPPFVDVPLGTDAPREFADRARVSPIALLPEGGGVLVSNPSDRTIYYYRETGMKAPSNSFQTYADPPLGLHVYDHSLKEIATTGTYESTTQFKYGGVYDVHFLLPTPRVATCFEMKLEGPAMVQKNKKALGKFVSLFKDQVFEPNKPSKIRFKLQSETLAKASEKVNKVFVQAFLFKKNWQVYFWAESKGNGVYEAEVTFPYEGEYVFLVESRKLGISAKSSGMLRARAQKGGS
jgi:YVTN family beta-propeller protein